MTKKSKLSQAHQIGPFLVRILGPIQKHFYSVSRMHQITTQWRIDIAGRLNAPVHGVFQDLCD